MNKFLLYSLSLVLAFVASVTFAQEVTFDFAGNNWKLPDSKAQGITNATDFTNGTYTITVSAPEKAYYLASNNAIIYGKKDAYINLPKFDFDVERIDIISPAGGSGKTTRNIFVGNKAVSTQTTGAKGTHQYEIAADNQAANTVYTIKVTNANNDQIQKILIWKKGSAKPIETKKVDNIAAFKAIGVGNKAILTLKNAQVQYVGTGDIYIVDETGGIDIYQSSLSYKAGQILNGTIEASYDEFKKLPELVNIAASDIKVTDGIVKPFEMTVEEAAKLENACKLVTIKDVTLVKAVEGEYTNYYTDAEKTMQIFDKFKLGYKPNTETAMDYTGIIIPFNTKIELAPTIAPTTSTTGITNITTDEAAKNAPVYNLAGQKVTKAYKGVVIKNGKKMIQK